MGKGQGIRPLPLFFGPMHGRKSGMTPRFKSKRQAAKFTKDPKYADTVRREKERRQSMHVPDPETGRGRLRAA